MSLDEDRLSLDTRKLELDEQRFHKSDLIEERKYQLDKTSRVWSQIATFVPIIAIIIAFLTNSRLESMKQTNADLAIQSKIQREFVDRQLSELYYPIKVRLEKDTAVWQLSQQLTGRKVMADGDKFSKYIENSVILPNHEEVVSILTRNFGLIKNANEKYDASALIALINQYQRHYSAYKTLRVLNIYSLNPTQVCDNCGFPLDFPKQISERIASLEAQRQSLSVK